MTPRMDATSCKAIVGRSVVFVDVVAVVVDLSLSFKALKKEGKKRVLALLFQSVSLLLLLKVK